LEIPVLQESKERPSIKITGEMVSDLAKDKSTPAMVVSGEH
jgi:hypothetical protein